MRENQHRTYRALRSGDYADPSSRNTGRGQTDVAARIDARLASMTQRLTGGRFTVHGAEIVSADRLVASRDVLDPAYAAQLEVAGDAALIEAEPEHTQTTEGMWL